MKNLNLAPACIFPESGWWVMDVDNAFKEVIDALQGALPDGSGRKRRMRRRVLPNNNLVCQAAIAKAPPKRGMSGGYVRLRRLV